MLLVVITNSVITLSRSRDMFNAITELVVTTMLDRLLLHLLPYLFLLPYLGVAGRILSLIHI